MDLVSQFVVLFKGRFFSKHSTYYVVSWYGLPEKAIKRLLIKHGILDRSFSQHAFGESFVQIEVVCLLNKYWIKNGMFDNRVLRYILVKKVCTTWGPSTFKHILNKIMEGWITMICNMPLKKVLYNCWYFNTKTNAEQKNVNWITVFLQHIIEKSIVQFEVVRYVNKYWMKIWSIGSLCFTACLWRKFCTTWGRSTFTCYRDSNHNKEKISEIVFIARA